MKRTYSKIAVSLAAFSLAAAMGIAPAYAADPTLTFNARTAGNAVLGLIPGTITVTASVAGKVAFSSKPKAATAAALIPGCESVNTAAAAPFTATCIWNAVVAGEHELTAQLTPNDAALAKVTTTRPLVAYVGTPINEGMGYTPVSVYVDTVTGTATAGSPTSLAPFLNNASCVQISQFVRGMTVVFRVYANDHTRDGIPLTSEHAKIEVIVAGVEKPIALSYGNHSGAAFWAGTLATGEPGSGRYSTLGTIKYTINVTLIEKPAVTKEVTTVKYVKVLKKGKAVKVDGKFVYKPVTVKKIEILEPEVKGLTYVYDPSRWPTTSLLTLNAVPTS
jgi:hypothetical protein